MEPVVELKRICQKKGANENGIKKAYRDISFYLTKFLLYFHLNANQVSIIGVEIGLFASAFFLFANPANIIIGGILSLFHTLFDYCDGEVSRYYASKREYKKGLGGFFDWSNCLPRPLIIFSLSIGLMNNFGEINPIIFIGLGAIFSYFWFLNQVFYALRKTVYMVNENEAFGQEIRDKISNTFTGRVANYLIKLFDFIEKLSKRMKITPVAIPKVKSPMVSARHLLRKSQNAHYIPFIFIASGTIDLFAFQRSYVTFMVWAYLGIASIALFLIEELLSKK